MNEELRKTAGLQDCERARLYKMKNEKFKKVNSEWIVVNGSYRAPLAHLCGPLTTHHSLLTKKAFTLAEVLITLGIIGVVAAITIPTLVAKYQEKVTVTRLKQTYSMLSQAFTNIVANEGTPDTWDLSSPDEFRDLFAKYMRNAKKCDADSGEKCQPDTVYNLNGTKVVKSYNSYENHSNLNLNNGVNLTFYLNPATYDKSCNSVYGGIENGCIIAIHADINGLKSPNTWGKDRFEFMLYKNKLLPIGHPDMTTHSFYRLCNDNNANGESCAAWVIYNENMDYLHCDDLSWNGKKKCK